MLDYQKRLYENGEKHLSAFGMMKCLTTLKQDGENNWLCNISSFSLQVICRDLDDAYIRFFKKTVWFSKI